MLKFLYRLHFFRKQIIIEILAMRIQLEAYVFCFLSWSKVTKVDDYLTSSFFPVSVDLSVPLNDGEHQEVIFFRLL